MKSLRTGNQASKPALKKNYMPPVLRDWGMLKDVTLSAGLSGSADGGKILFTRTRL
jgi:hypothetical protein